MRKTREGYVQLVNGFYMNWKVRKLRLENPTALGVFAMILSYCGFNLSDGWITGNDLKYVIGASDDEILALCDVEMLVMDEENDRYMVHDYLRHNRSSVQVTKKRASNTTVTSVIQPETAPESADNDETGTLFDANADVTVQKNAETSAEPPKTVHVSGQTSEHQNIRTSEHQTITPPTPSHREGDGASVGKPTTPPGSSDEDYSLDFEQFWNVYPRREGKRAAFNAFQKARRKTNKTTMIAKASQYAADPNRDPGYTLIPAKWLDGEHWLDDPLPARHRPVTSNKSQTGLEENMRRTWEAMSPEERANYQQGGGYGLIAR